jgi:predicted nucleic acid-binding protein
MSSLVDTDILIDALNGQSAAIGLLTNHSPDGLAISVISLGEIYDGVLGSPDPAQHLQNADAFLRPYPVLSLDRSVMLRFAELRVFLRARGQLIPDFDLLIASTALVHNLTLITGNQRHFQRIPGLMLSGYG